MSNPLFLLGAGFNKDAKNEAGEIAGVNCNYPLVDELYNICSCRFSTLFPSPVSDLFPTFSVVEL